ncbi:hypothetical protein R2083_02530 [Nitrosomonas sp. Is35]|uniref:hypothetical protein n=1 Tax=Nitrosomonas sp. Is35 TaxID=3080534 RepID=UPI00294AF471|nr:hypothetical protein [Nitrosomonas sp. Is35]MDV6346394.1 hypothetical protein [Nitrosomonas sp. Is35]
MLSDNLRFMLIVSAVNLTQVNDPRQEGILVTSNTHVEHSTLCQRCISNLYGQRHYA